MINKRLSLFFLLPVMGVGILGPVWAAGTGEPTLPIGETAGGWTSMILMLLCLMGVAFFSSSEASLLSVSKIRIRHLCEKGHRGAQAVARLVKKHDKLFATILTIENALIILASSLGTVIILRAFGERYLLVGSLVMTVFIVIFGEITPKTFAAQHAEPMSLLVSRPMELIIRLVWWAIWPFTVAAGFLLRLVGSRYQHKTPFATEAEIKMLIEIGRREGMLPPEQSEILENVFDLKATKVSHAMVPRPRIAALEDTAPVQEAIQLLERTDFTRCPVYHENIDRVVGVVNLHEVVLAVVEGRVRKEDPLSSFIQPAQFVPESKPLTELLKDFQEHRHRIAIVADEYGGTSGLITMEDVLEEIVGDILHETPPTQSIRTVHEDRLLMAGDVSIEEVGEHLKIGFPRGDYNTIAGFLMACLEEIPRVGQYVRHAGYEFRVTGRAGPRVTEVMAVRLPPPPPTPLNKAENLL